MVDKERPDMGDKEKLGVGVYTSFERDGSGLQSTNRILYEKYKGKNAVGSREWETTAGEKTALIIVMVLCIIIVASAFVVYFLPVSVLIKVLAIILAGILFIALVGGLILIVTLRHNKKEPMEMKYYDVDYEYNAITGKGYDNTKEITKEEFFSSDKKADK